MHSSAAHMQDEATTITARTAGQIMHIPLRQTPGSYPGSIAGRSGGKKKSDNLNNYFFLEALNHSEHHGPKAGNYSVITNLGWNGRLQTE